MADEDDAPLVVADADDDDEDAPLSGLTETAPKVEKRPVAKDDDTPLSLLVAKIPVKAATTYKPKVKAVVSKPSASTGKPKQAGTVKAKEKVKRKRDSSSGSSSSSSSSSSSESSGDKPLRKSASKEKILRKKTTDGEMGGDKPSHPGPQKATRSIKEQVSAELLSRWWYVLPDWPPSGDEFYKPLLEARQMRKVRVEEWEWVAEVDEEGRKKVYELSQYRGCFRDAAGDFFDLRPLETCPSLYNVMKKDLPELYDLLCKAYEGQIEDLKNSVFDETVLEASLKARLNGIREKANNASQIGSVKRKA